MAKSVYSLVLSDDVVAAIDQLAVRGGYSRSAFINHLLAESASLSTPEQRMREVIAAVEQAMADAFRMDLSPGGVLTLRTAPRYKYNPAVAYVVELAEDAHHLEQLRVGLSSQNERSPCPLHHSLAPCAELDRQHLPHPPDPTHQSRESTRSSRCSRRPPSMGTEQDAGEAIATYVSLLDACLKTFFDHPDNVAAASAATHELYTEQLPNLGIAAEF